MPPGLGEGVVQGLAGGGAADLLAGFLAGDDSSEFLKYAPSREMRILHFTLDVTPDFVDLLNP